ncbi:MAG TPA: PQQ-binding-like beta-propeller repeat protein [Candidatus Binataceae bacterium]|nr:PQQ-binding-like beta-propeller repeat protein [Candidatus Binataceae bacterium]
MNLVTLRSRTTIVASIFAIACHWVTGASALAPNGLREEAPSVQIDTAHTGGIQFPEGFAPPLTKAWSIDTGGNSTYALIAEGKVFVLSNGYDVLAYDLATGSRVWEHLVSNGTMGIAYDKGQLFLIDAGGLMTALKSKSGKIAWSAQMPGGEWLFLTPPIAADGQVYTYGAGFGATLYAVDEKTGHVNWSHLLEGGAKGSPAFGGGGVYVSFASDYYKFSTTGRTLWHYDAHGGGGGSTPTYFKKRVYINDISKNAIVDSKSGDIVGTYAGNDMPAFFSLDEKDYGLTIVDNKLSCFNAENGNVVWNFSASGLAGYPIVINGQPIVGSTSGSIYMLDGKNGKQIWTDKVSGTVLSGLSAGEGKLVVVFGNIVTVYAPQ